MARTAQPLLAHGTRFGLRVLLLLAIIHTVACEKDAPTRTVRVRAAVPNGCLNSDPQPTDPLWLAPLGDFSETLSPIQLQLGGPQPLPFPAGTVAIRARVEAAQGELGGIAERALDESTLSILLWPATRTCPLLDSGGFGIGTAIGYSPQSHVLLLAGGDVPGEPAASVAATIFDTAAGRGGRLASESSSAVDGTSLSEPRAFATISPFGSGLLVAGGENPLRVESELATPSRTAEIFAADQRRFSPGHVQLAVERSRHAALVLASGDTLLIGGRGPNGAALNVLETVSPLTGRSSIAGLAALKAPRLFPAALQLDDGRIFVGGGTASDGRPLGALEWLSSDAREHLALELPQELPRRYDRVFAALPGGGVLAVGGCQINSETSCRGPCRLGCPPEDGADPDNDPDYDASWITADGQVFSLRIPFAAPQPAILGGSDGMPIVAGGTPSDSKLYRFDPWTVGFSPVLDFGATGPGAASTPLALDPQTHVWFGDAEAGPTLMGARIDVPHRFESPSDLFDASSGKRWLVPDRPAQHHVEFDPAAHQLIFTEDSQVTVFVAGTDYAGLSLLIWAEGGTPEVVLGNQVFGGADCPWPHAHAAEYRLERRAEQVQLYADGSASPPCAVSPGRLRLGVRRGTDAVVVRELRVRREPL
ncbi:MAG TPA: hypothetical protein VFQ61_31235 [Polyangiaceae bacterium]|nr:hypothetical protein [Polyangiaceae bacterium]